ncbi:MAG: hypothetical protein QXS98_02375 [Candidatus Nitrosocaldus sp.]
MISASIEDIITKLVANNVDSIIPTIDDEGNISYPVLEGLSIPVEMLEDAVKDNILERHIYKRMLICPIHVKVLSLPTLHCPQCKSNDIKKINLIEHITCGFIGERDRFDSGGRLVCPSCDIQITEKNSNMLGAWYTCNLCSAKFNAPLILFQCNNHQLDIAMVDIKDIFYYTVRKGLINNEYDVSEVFTTIYQILESKNISVMKMHPIKGRSGVVHTVPLYINDYRGNDIVIEYCIDNNDTNISNNNFIQVIIKLMDLQAKHMILICIPKMRDELRYMAATNNIMVIEGNNKNVIIANLLDIVNSKILQNRRG